MLSATLKKEISIRLADELAGTLSDNGRSKGLSVENQLPVCTSYIQQRISNTIAGETGIEQQIGEGNSRWKRAFCSWFVIRGKRRKYSSQTVCQTRLFFLDSHRGNAPKYPRKQHKRNIYEKESKMASIDSTGSDEVSSIRYFFFFL